VSGDSQTVEACRSCGGRELLPVLDLGKTPLANRLLEPARRDEPEPSFPLNVVFCPACALVQITETVSPEVLFREYFYFSSVSDALVEHSRIHAEALVAGRRLGRGSRVIEAASNDGYLLKWFQPHGVEVLGVEPARNIARVANERGVPTRADFFGLETAQRLVAEGLTADVVLGNNVLAHVADLNGFVAGAALLLRPGGIVELEFPWVVDLVDHVEFDTIYHEHLCYFSAHAIEALFRRHGLVLTDVLHLPTIHGGTLRVTGAKQAVPRGGGGSRPSWPPRRPAGPTGTPSTPTSAPASARSATTCAPR
jgi:SAM-dependent methyltransferase